MKQRALVDINMILDTRLGALARMDATEAARIVKSQWYQDRDRDKFEEFSNGLINDEVFKDIYSRYEVETLEKALFTNYIEYATNELDDILPDLEITGIDGTIKYDINVYPYKLMASEKEVIRRAVARYLTDPAEVRVIDRPWSDFTPEVIYAEYEMLLIYNYENWFIHHLEALRKFPINDFTVFHPRISPTNEVPEPTPEIKDPFMATPMVLVGYIQLHPIPTYLSNFNMKAYSQAVSQIKNHQD